MAVLLLIVIYIAFIGLGIPDSLFGPAWPAIYGDFHLPISYASFVSCTVTICTVISSYFAARIINRVGTRNVVIVSTLMTCIGLIGYSISPNLGVMMLFAIPLGLGAGCIDSGLNNYVALHYSNMQMNFLHCFYGIGVTLSPYVMSMALSTDLNWRRGYLIAFCIQLGIACILLGSYPLWSRVKVRHQEEVTPITLSTREILSRPIAVFAALVFFFYCGLEVSCGVWSSTYFVNHKGFLPSVSSSICALFYAGLASGRLYSGLLSKLIKPKTFIITSMLFVSLGIVLLLPSGQVLPYIALFLIGFGCGPIFPNMILLTPSYYGKEYSQSLIGFQMAMAYSGTLLLSPLFGVLADCISVSIFPLYLGIVFLLFGIMFMILNIFLLKKKRNEVFDYEN